MNPGAMLKLLSAKNTFDKNHPKFSRFVKDLLSEKIQEGTVFEITVTRPGREPVTANFKVQPSDLELMESLKSLKE